MSGKIHIKLKKAQLLYKGEDIVEKIKKSTISKC